MALEAFLIGPLDAKRPGRKQKGSKREAKCEQTVSKMRANGKQRARVGPGRVQKGGSGFKKDSFWVQKGSRGFKKDSFWMQRGARRA